MLGAMRLKPSRRRNKTLKGEAQMRSPMMNGKAEKFRTLAEKRVSRVLANVRLISHLSRRGSYEYTPEQVAHIFRSIRDELDIAERAFAPPAQFSLNLPASDHA